MLLQGMEGSVMGIWVQHGEGTINSLKLLHRLKHSIYILLFLLCQKKEINV